MKTIINTRNAPKAIGPYNQAIEVDGWIFTSGQIALDPESQNMRNANVAEEANQVLKNLEAVLKQANSNFDLIVKSSIFLLNLDDFDVVNEIYQSYFKSNVYPARETVQVARLPKDARVEISVIAKKA